MKKMVLFGLLLTGACLLAASTAFSHWPDAPHNQAVMLTTPAVNCAPCHFIGLTLGVFWGDDAVCTSCHTNGSPNPAVVNYTLKAPAVKTHSSANTSTKYGTWAFKCADCHDPKSVQEQFDWVSYTPANRSNIYLVTGKITSIHDNGDNTTTFGYNNLVVNQTCWGDTTRWNNKTGYSNDRGLIFLDTTDSRFSFEIKSSTSNTITVKGSLNKQIDGNPIKMNVGDSFALTYGQLISNNIPSPIGLTSVAFWQNSAANSFANDIPNPSVGLPGICATCHTKTNHWRNDGSRADHNPGTKCTLCHKHENGFKASLDGTGCR